MSAPVIIEAAINGGTPKSRNPNSPRSVEEIAADAIRAVDAGAAIVHNHNDDAVIGEGPRLRAGWHDPQPYVDAWRAVLDQRPDTIFYPTQASGGPGTDISVRLSHIAALDAAGVLGQGLIDPGCVALGGADAEGLPNDSDNVYINTYRDARGMFALSNRLRGGQGAGPASRSSSRASCAWCWRITRRGSSPRARWSSSTSAAATRSALGCSRPSRASTPTCRCWRARGFPGRSR